MLELLTQIDRRVNYLDRVLPPRNRSTRTSPAPKTPQAAQLEKHGPLVWLRELFPDLFALKTSLDFAPHHKELWLWYWAALQAKRDGKPFPNNLNAYFAIWSRGHSKSTHARILPIAEAAVVGHGYCLYTSGTQELANGHVTEIEGLLDSERVAYYYPEIVKPERSSISNQSKSWRQDLLRTASGYVFQAIGLNVGIRGANKGGVRPSLIIPDDIDDKKDSPLVAENKADTFLNSVLPTKGKRTLFVCAQNLIHEHGVINQIYTGKIRALANAVVVDPIPAVRNLETEERTEPSGRIRDVIVSGEPTWPGYDLDRCQEDIDDYTLDVFKRECQHDLRGSREGRMLKSWNDNVHVITEEEFESVFGTRTVPRHWKEYGAHDWSATRSDYHSCVAAFLSVSSQNSKLPGHFFLHTTMSFEEDTQPDDVAMRVVKFLAPEVDWDALLNAEVVRKQLEEAAQDPDLTRSLERRRQVVAGVVRDRVSTALKARPLAMMHMSHEAKNKQNIYRQVYGLPFDACNPGRDGGVVEMNHFMRVDYKTPNPFRPGEMGYTRFHVIVRKRTALPITMPPPTEESDRNAELLRYQFERWRWRPPTLTDAGLLPEKPLKMHDDFGNALMMLFIHFQMQAAALTEKEQIEEALPPPVKQSTIEQLPDDEKSGAMMKRQVLIKDLRQERESKNIADPRIRAKLKRRRRR